MPTDLIGDCARCAGPTMLDIGPEPDEQGGYAVVTVAWCPVCRTERPAAGQPWTLDAVRERVRIVRSRAAAGRTA